LARREKRIFFSFFEKEKKSKIFLIFFVAIFRNLWPQRKSQIFGSFFSACFSASSFFVFENNWNIFFIVRALPKRLINVGHDFQKVPMPMKISHGGVCIFVMGVSLLCDPMAYV
jgi:hypothetical protein